MAWCMMCACVIVWMDRWMAWNESVQFYIGDVKCKTKQGNLQITSHNGYAAIVNEREQKRD